MNSVGASIQLDPLTLIKEASGPVFVVVWMLILSAAAVWFIAALKSIQLWRLAQAERRFEDEAGKAHDSASLIAAAERMNWAPGARVVLALGKKVAHPELLPSAARKALHEEQKRAAVLMVPLSTIASTAPFIGLFGTVYGIMDAFLRIGRMKSASLPVVAPAIGEALVATAIGLAAAIPAVVVYNALNKQIDELLSSIEIASEGWIAQTMVKNESS